MEAQIKPALPQPWECRSSSIVTGRHDKKAANFLDDSLDDLLNDFLVSFQVHRHIQIAPSVLSSNGQKAADFLDDFLYILSF